MSRKRRTLRIIVFLFLTACLLPACALPPPVTPGRVSLQDRGEALYLEGEALYRRQDYQQAWQRYDAYLVGNPQGRFARQARLRQAEIQGLLGNWQGALVRYEALLAEGQAPDVSAQVRYNIGRAYYKLDQLQQASQVLESLTAAELPASVRFSTNALLAEIALRRGQVQNAFVRLRLAAQDLPAGDREWFDYVKTRLVEQATTPELERLVNLYRDSPLCAPLLLRLAQIAQKEGRGAEAQQWLQTLKERYPESPEARQADSLLAPRRALLGCLLPLSGDFADVGRRLRQGMELAAKDSPMELIFKDCPSDQNLCIQGVRALAAYPNLLAFLGPVSSADAESAAKSAQELGIPLIAMSQKAGLTGTGEMVFQMFLMARPQVQRLVGHAANLGLTRFASFAPNAPYGNAFSKLFQEEVSLRGGVLAVQEFYPPGTRDFSLALSPLLSQFHPGTAGSPTFDVLFIPDDAPTVAAVLEQIADHPLGRVQILGTNLVRPSTHQQNLARSLEGVLFADAFFAGDPQPAVQGFVTAFRQRYGAEPDYMAAQGYLAVRLLAKVLETDPAITRAELPRRLQSLSGIPELPWFLGFGPDRQAELALYLLTMKDGKVQQAVPATGAPGKP